MMIKFKFFYISLLLTFFLTAFSFASLKEERTAKAMIKVQYYYQKRNWPKIIKQAYLLFKWGEKKYVLRCLKMVEPIIMAKKSPAGVLHLSSLYGKLKKDSLKQYWFEVYLNLKKMKRRRWKKS